MLYGRSWTTLLVKGQMESILVFAGYMVSAVTTQLCPCSPKAAIDNMSVNEHGCVSVKLDLKERMAGQVWPVGRSWRGGICRERVMVGALQDMGLGRPHGHGSGACISPGQA